METPDIPSDQVRSELVELLVQTAEAPADWAALVTPQARLDADLLLDEYELARLAELLLARFGPRADLATLRASLGLDALEALTVGDLERALLAGTSAEAAR